MDTEKIILKVTISGPADYLSQDILTEIWYGQLEDKLSFSLFSENESIEIEIISLKELEEETCYSTMLLDHNEYHSNLKAWSVAWSVGCLKYMTENLVEVLPISTNNYYCEDEGEQHHFPLYPPEDPNTCNACGMLIEKIPHRCL